jgi:hypothetical protein
MRCRVAIAGQASQGKRCLLDAWKGVPPARIEWERPCVEDYLIGSGDSDTGVSTRGMIRWDGHGIMAQLCPNITEPRGSWGSSIHGAQALQATEVLVVCIRHDYEGDLKWYKERLSLLCTKDDNAHPWWFRTSRASMLLCVTQCDRKCTPSGAWTELIEIVHAHNERVVGPRLGRSECQQRRIFIVWVLRNAFPFLPKDLCKTIVNRTVAPFSVVFCSAKTGVGLNELSAAVLQHAGALGAYHSEEAETYQAPAHPDRTSAPKRPCSVQ